MKSDNLDKLFFIKRLHFILKMNIYIFLTKILYFCKQISKTIVL